MTPAQSSVAQARAAFTEYVKGVRKAHGKGTPENTYLPLLKPLFEGLLPEYHVITHPSKDAQGLPDFALREPGGAENLVLGEAEALDMPLDSNKHGWAQARGYAKQAPTLLTNFHDFVVLDGDTELGRYTIPHAELTGTAKPAALADAHLENLSGLLGVWASARGSLSRPQKIAGLLAYHARQALAALDSHDTAALSSLRKAMEDALGSSFSVPKPKASGKANAEKQRRDEAKWREKQEHLDHFFRSSLVQALFYGLFSAWVMAARQGQGAQFTHSEAGRYLRVPVINLLFDQLTASKLDKLGMRPAVERAVSLLRRVDPEAFLKGFQDGQAVTYFYEPFLDAFDPGLREELGVWYTPPELIAYQIRRVHALLQSELGIADGLLDPRVTILDPATGTGGYLLELGHFLQAEMQRQDKSFIGARLKEAFQTRIFGFELLPAPFSIAHVQLALLLQNAGGGLTGHERVNVLLTNSLNGWTPQGDKQPPVFSELAEEQAAAEQVKGQQQIMVMIGNPPYARFADMPDNPEEQALIAPYKQCLRESWGVKKQLLDDLYIRFLRLAEWRVAENGKEGIVSFVTNRSYLTGISHPVMRQHLLSSFDQIYIDDLHGNQRANRAGDGSVFTTTTNGGIRVGVAIGTFVKKAGVKGAEGEPAEPAQVHYREFYGSGARKRAALTEDETPYAPAFTPKREHRYVLRPLKGEDAYWEWPTIDDLFPVGLNGVNTSKDEVVTAFEEKALAQQFEEFYDPEISESYLSIKYPRLMSNASRYDPIATRKILLGKFTLDKLEKYSYRPFDNRYIWYKKETKLVQEKNIKYHEQIDGGFATLVSAQGMRRGFDGIYFSHGLIDFHTFDPDAEAFPLRLRFKDFVSDTEYQYLPNSADFYDDLARAGVLKVSAPKADSACTPMPKPAPVLSRYGVVRGPDGKPNALAWELAEQVFYHTLAVLSAPAYREEHAEYLAEDWPRVPMPPRRETLEQSAAVGRRVAALLDPQARPDMPGTVGRLVRAGTDDEAAQDLLSIGPKPSYDKVREVYVLSDTLELAGVPERVWAFTLGGYPVLKNWVEYRKGRTLTLDDAEWLEGIVRRVSALLDLGGELDVAYEAATGVEVVEHHGRLIFNAPGLSITGDVVEDMRDAEVLGDWPES